ncbi:hypothetical protein RJ490_004607 [Pluralibacter gergoviae]|nr:hypothetical protein [Pluralibacter gergoviae]ELD4273681.1 hypothetical protein [Pluralibacter gergoviae]ELD4279293.1 hypothetical protein [Pluralibacter gergoviae]ELD4318764.1 hypothetical protein [Pluralibacter gergoviae]ELD4343843.1 hypothetical protein [Pluralibacter gergoviae]
MRNKTFIPMLLISLPFFAQSSVKCDISYTGGTYEWRSEEIKLMGVNTGAYTYTCKECGGINIYIFPANDSQAAYEFKSQDDFVKKINSEYVKKDIAKMELESLSLGGELDIDVTDIGEADFFPTGTKQHYLYYKAVSRNKVPTSYTGFVTSDGANTCSIIASYFGSDIPSDGRKALSNFMNHLSL